METGDSLPTCQEKRVKTWIKSWLNELVDLIIPNVQLEALDSAVTKLHSLPYKQESRETWGHSAEFLLSLLGCAVGPGNLLRFPYLCMRNGGGAFLIPYFLSLFTSGIPLYFIEIYMGQSTRRSCIALWDKFAPIMKGTGYSMVLLAFTWAVLYQSAIAWSIYYMGASLTWTLPWTSCNQTWNTPNCVLTTDIGNVSLRESYRDNASFRVSPSTDSNYGNFSMDWNLTRMSAAEEYWQYNVLRLSDSLEDVGFPNWKVCIAHLIGIIIIYLCIIKGVRSVGKVVWVTATLPYVFILVFLVRAALLPGSLDGIKYYLTPDLNSLKDPEPWILAFLQIFYTLAVGHGCIQTMASYNHRNKNFLYEVFIIPMANCLTSFTAGFVVFGCIGFLAFKSAVPVGKAMSTGPGLAFVSYPELTSHLPGGPIWSFCFFFMLLILALDSMFVMFETLVSGIVDEFNLSKRQRQVVLGLVMLADLLFGPLLFTNSGMYIFQLLDWYFSTLALFLVSALELLAITWLYGYQRFADDVHSMIGRRPHKWIILPLIGFILPTLLLTAMFWSISKISKPMYGTYVFPDWSERFGWCYAVAIASPVFIVPIIQLLSRTGKASFKDNLRGLVKAERSQEQNVMISVNAKCDSSDV